MKFRRKNQWRVENIFRKFYIKFGECLQKICGISKLISRPLESKKFKIIKFRPSRNISYMHQIFTSLTDHFFHFSLIFFKNLNIFKKKQEKKGSAEEKQVEEFAKFTRLRIMALVYNTYIKNWQCKAILKFRIS